MVQTLDAGRGKCESHFTRDDPPPKVIWFWGSLIAVSTLTIFFVWPSEGSGEYTNREELPNPNFALEELATFLLAGFLGGAVIKLSLAAFKMRDARQLNMFSKLAECRSVGLAKR